MSTVSPRGVGAIAQVPGCMTTYLPLKDHSDRTIDAEQLLRASCDYTLSPSKLAKQMRSALHDAGARLAFRPQPVALDDVVLRSFYAGRTSIEILRKSDEVLFGGDRDAQDLVRGGAAQALTRITDQAKAIDHQMRGALVKDLGLPDKICPRFTTVAEDLPSRRWGCSVTAAAHIRAAGVLMDYGASPMGPARDHLMGALSAMNRFNKAGIDADTSMDWAVDPKPLRARWSRVDVDLSLAATDALLATSRRFVDHWGIAMAAQVTEPQTRGARP